jgi:hypothetical protein
MTKRTINTIQYNLFFNDLNAALKLAYTVRAIRLTWHGRLEELESIDSQLRQAWVDRGFTEAEVEQNGLTALSWDLKQLGWSERRSPLEVYELHVLKMIKDGIDPISDLVFANFDPSRYPFAARYRFADLVHSIDVEKTLRRFIEKSSQLRDDRDCWGSYSGTPLEKFILLRRPIPVIPGAYQVQRAEAFAPPHIGLLLELDMSERDIEAAIDDFRFHIAEAQSKSGLANSFTNRVFHEWAMGSTAGTDQDSISVFTQIGPVLAGLQAYDTMKRNGGSQKRGARAKATKATAEFFREKDPRRDSHKVGQWLDAQRKKIETVTQALVQAHGRPD